MLRIGTVDERRAAARRLWSLFENYHVLTYFTPESRAAADALGCKGGWMGYFAQRAAPFGEASPELVISTFYNFHPGKVRRALPDAWAVAGAERFLTARLSGVDGALRRLLGEEVLAGPELAELAELGREAASAAPITGRPLAAANAALPWPEQPHLVLWHAATILRESRGDGHIATLVAAGLDPCEALVVYAADHDMSGEAMRGWRGWSEQEWQDAADRLTDRGLLADDELTPEGDDLRAWCEQRTDDGAAVPWVAVGEEATQRFAELLTPIARTLAAGNEAFKNNPMALHLVT
ncbi:SCO6745 family protein [Allokutzneria oryzae]|uniref:SalK n=1 Tax=Allokutzneria oryzae TaxID=1378989 RepID=A0ABV6A422_9PSEU